MYAAILRSIEAKDYSWADNFDRFEAILYRRNSPRQITKERGGEERSNKKWFCRDWNKGGCSKTAPHRAWFGSGPSSIARNVLHMCAVCYLREKAQRDHPETSEACPHKA